MKKITWRAGTMLYPLPPALISCGTLETPNLLTVAWTGVVSSDPAMTYISLRKSRYSHEIIKESGNFVINLPTEKLVRAVDFCGVKSGKDMNKFAAMKLTPEASSKVSSPLLGESPLSLECVVKEIKELGSHDMFLSEIVAINVDETLVDEKGAFHLEQAGLLAFCHGEYFGLGKSFGKFGFSVRKKKDKAKKVYKEKGYKNKKKSLTK